MADEFPPSSVVPLSAGLLLLLGAGTHQETLEVVSQQAGSGGSVVPLLLGVGAIAAVLVIGTRAVAAAKDAATSAKDAAADAVKDLVAATTGAESERSEERKAREAREAAEAQAAQVGAPPRAVQRRAAIDALEKMGFDGAMKAFWGSEGNAARVQARWAGSPRAELDAMIEDPRTDESARELLRAWIGGARLPAQWVPDA